MNETIRLSLLVAALAAGGCHSSTTHHGIEVAIEDGQLMVSDSIRFETNSDQLAEGSTVVLDAIAGFLVSHSGIDAIRVEGHTDAHGSEEHNENLGLRRAETVAAYLREHGVTQTLTTEGYSSTRPLCNDPTPECDALNRRVEFYLVEVE